MNRPKKIKLITLCGAVCQFKSDKNSDFFSMTNFKHQSCFALALIFFAINILFSVESVQSYDATFSNSSTIAKSRMKRYLIFQPGTRIFVSLVFNLTNVRHTYPHSHTVSC